MGIFSRKRARAQNAAGLSRKWLERIREDLAGLADVRSGLDEAALRFVVDGDGPEVLEQVARSRDAGAALELRSIQGLILDEDRHPTERQALLDDAAELPPEVVLRLAKVWEAATRPVEVHLALAGPELDALRWVQVLLREATRYTTHISPRGVSPTELTIRALGRVIEADGGEAHALVSGALATADPIGDRYRATPVIGEILLAIEGYAELLNEHLDLVAEHLRAGNAARRVGVIRLLESAGADLVPLAEVLTDIAVSSAKSAREAAQARLLEVPEVAIPLLQQRATEGKAGERAQAVLALGRLREHEDVRAFLVERREEERAARVLEALDRSLAPDATATPKERETAAVTLAALPPIEIDAKLPEGFAARLGELYAATAEKELARRRSCAAKAKPGEHYHLKDFNPLDRKGLMSACRALETWVGQPGGELPQPVLFIPGWSEKWDRGLEKLVRMEGLELIHVLRLELLLLRAHPFRGHPIDATSGPTREDGRIPVEVSGPLLDAFWEARGGDFGLREVAQALDALGFDGNGVAAEFLGGWTGSEFAWSDEALAPFWAEHVDRLVRVFDGAAPSTTDAWARSYLKSNALRALRTLPAAPPVLADALWDVALGTAKTVRRELQDILDREADAGERLLGGLADRRQESRAQAAQWIARRGDRDAVPALMKALKEEKHDAAKSEIMTALDRLGVDESEWLDRGALHAEAKRALAKAGAIPNQLAWFPFDALPSAHWEPGGDAIPGELLTWFVVQACKLKSPVASALLRRVLARAPEAEHLGDFVLEQWIARDTALPDPDDVRNEAQRQSQLYNIPFQQVLDLLASHPVGSAIKEKGLLAICGATCGANAVKRIAGYVDTWYGYRAPQCKALLECLASIDHPAAAQLLLRIANRFRTKGIRERAAELVHEVAERRGWTIDQLADRMIPTGGVDEDGAMELDFGARKFTARIDAELKLSVFHADGRKLASLPKPGVKDDAERAKEAKKLLSAGRKVVKTTVKLQSERLYEAMVTQRRWRFEEWDADLHRHPIVRHLVTRLVWATVPGEGSEAVLFRPLGDGSLSDAEDGAVTLDAEDALVLAHDVHAPEGAAAAWLRHLGDYEIQPLFPQLGRELESIPEERLEDTSYDAFEGHLIEAFALRGAATKLGWVRGAAEDAGVFWRYLKPLPRLSLEAELEFSGNQLPEENRTVALRSLGFVRTAGRGGESAGRGRRIRLGEVPEVLLIETLNDLRTLAAQGTGFDPGWESKVEF